MRTTRSKTGMRRSHHALSAPRLSVCTECNAQHVRHQVCMACGTYRGRAVVDVASLRARTEARRKEKRRALGQPTGAPATADASGADNESSAGSEHTPLSAEGLSHKKA